jgi:hypothetical protein
MTSLKMSPQLKRWLALGSLVVLAGAKNWLLSSAYPLFHPADEGFHYDLICQIADARLPPPSPEPVLTGTAIAFLLYASPEYLNALESSPVPNAQRVGNSYHSILPKINIKAEELRQNIFNIELGSPPAYYALGSVWRLLGEGLAIDRINLIYWQRWFHALLAMIFVLLALYLSIHIRWAPDGHDAGSIWILPLLAATFPADYFYYITPDALTAVAGALALISLISPFTRSERVNLCVTAGIFFLLPFIRLSTIVWIAALPLLMALTWPSKPLRNRLFVGCSSLIAGAALLAGANLFFHGEPWGLQNKQAFLTWTEKPFFQWLDHPLFSPDGAWIFLRETITSFWRGSLTWNGSPVSFAGLDSFFLTITLLTLLAMPVWIVRHVKPKQQAMPITNWRSLAPGPSELCLVGAGWLLFVGGLAFLAILSIRFDFGTCYFPSAAFPYFTTGRLLNMNLLGFLAGFAMLFERFLARLGRWHYVFWILFAGSCVAFQFYVAWLPFQSPFNWFHLRGL